jgi:hypothetical protein
MKMTDYPVRCQSPGCSEVATYKIAARWSNGLTQELKTYALCCDNCLRQSFQQSLAKQSLCHCAPGENLEQPGIYRLKRSSRDRDLLRVKELEDKINSMAPG